VSASIKTVAGRSFVRVVFGPTAGEERRRCECSVATALTARGITCAGFALNDGGCTFVVASGQVPALRAALAMLNVAVRVRGVCAQVALDDLDASQAIPGAHAVITLLAAQGVGVVHLTSGERGLFLIVRQEHAAAAAETISRLCASGRLRVA
jgi:hypothetical protein